MIMADGVALLWFRRLLQRVFDLYDNVIKRFIADNEILIEFLNGKYTDPVTGVPVLAVYLKKLAEPYLKLSQLSAVAQAEFFQVARYNMDRDLEESETENGVLFVFRMTDGSSSIRLTDTESRDFDGTSGPSFEEICNFGARFHMMMFDSISLQTMSLLLSMMYAPMVSYTEHVADVTEPLVSYSATAELKGPAYPGQPLECSYSEVMKRDAVMGSLSKFQDTIRTTIQKLEGVVFLTIPKEMATIEKDESRIKEKSTLRIIESTCNIWLSQLQDSLNALDDKYFVGSSPLDEQEYWRDRYTNLDLLSKQLKNSSVSYIIAIQNKKNGLMTPTIERLEGLLIEAKENNRFLSTCERHFRNIEQGANYQILIETIAPLMKSLRLIWMISRHYNDDEKMVSLMEKIARVVINRVKKVNNFSRLFDNGSELAKHRTANAETLLRLWKQSYLETRHYIEISGRGTRWEFDRKRLFQLTDYMANVSHDINAAVHVMEEFNQLYELNIFTVTMKSGRVIEMKANTSQLFTSFQTCKFDPYDPNNERTWFLKMEAFYKEVVEIEIISQMHIQDAFRNIRSPLMGIQLLKSLSKILVRSSLKKTLNDKQKDISSSFLNQISKTRQDFEDHFMNPPLFKSQPPVAGAIHWQRFLFIRLKNTLISLLSEADFLSVEETERLKDNYLSLCKEMQQYSQNKYQEWYDKVGPEMDSLLKHCILVVPGHKSSEVPAQRMGHVNSAPGDDSYKDLSLNGGAKSQKNSTKILGVKTLNKFDVLPAINNNNNNSSKADVAKNRRVSVTVKNNGIDKKFMNLNSNNNSQSTNVPLKRKKNFLPQRLSSKIGKPLRLPKLEKAALPKNRASNQNQNAAKPTMQIFAPNETTSVQTAASLTDFENLKQHNLEVNFDSYILEVILEAKYLESLGYRIPESVKSAAILEQNFHESIHMLNGFLRVFHEEIKKLNEVDFMVLEEPIKELLRVVFSGTKRVNWRSAGISDFVEHCHAQLEGFMSIVYQYKKNIKRIEKRLGNIENASHFSNKVNFKVGVVVDCKDYFGLVSADREEVIERLIQDYKDITSMIQHIEFVIWKSSSWKCAKMKPFYSYYENRIYKALTKMVISNLNTFICLLSGKKTLFQIHAVLYHPYLELSPNLVNILKYINQCTAECIYTTKQFPRWMHGTAIPVTPNKDNGQYAYSFLNDISLNPDIISLAKKIQDIAEEVLIRAKNTLNPWKRFDVVWLGDKELVVQDWVEKTLPKASDYDGVLYSLKKQISEINAEKSLVDIGYLQLNLSMLLTSVKEHYFHLFDLYTSELHFNARSALIAFKMDCERKLDEMSFKPTTIQDLKSVLQLINNIFDSSVEKELIISDIIEKYDVLDIYGVNIADDEKVILQNMEIISYLLIDKAKFYYFKLSVVKRKFADMALKESSEFHRALADLVLRFNAAGPGTVDDLDLGLNYIREFNSELYKMEQKRQNIGNSQKLFDLPIPTYTDFFNVQKQMNDLEMIYKIFRSYIDARGEWDVIMWADLSVKSLQEGIEGLISQAGKLPKHVKQLKVYSILESTMKSFKDNLPIFVELKNDSLRERHWKTMMDKTNINLESNFGAMTMKTLFAMNLAEHYDAVCEIIADAIKEANIEKVLKEIELTWSSLKFTVLKYQKSSVDKGYMIGSVEEINLLLDDQIMQLQGMSASRNVGPFLNSVQSWERQLSLVSEVVFSWVITQRKWLYLDSIFLSSDIKIQLPEEARLFEKLDKAYMKIMKNTALSPLVKNCCLVPYRLRELEDLIIGLDKCQKSLNEYLDSKRNAFPRFFFISDDELLSIIGSTDPLSIQEHIIKMFDNVASLNFRPGHGGTQDILGMVSVEGEQLAFKRRISSDGKVELWMSSALQAMKDANRLITKEAIYYYCAESTSRIDWLMKYQGMVCLAGNQVWWTWEVEDVFQKIVAGDKQAMKNYSKKLIQQIDDLVILVRTSLPPNDRKKINTVLIIDVHARDIIDGFVRDSILNANDFEWESQLRFYWELYSDQLIVHQCSGRFSYGYEYMGLNGRLVITPLTDRIYLTLTQALFMKLGGAPAGPAGTGKTETTKDLAKALGLLCVVTNCGEGMDYKAIGKIFAGLCQSGSWGCFDEFNRIEVSVLSVISSQLQTIRNALLMNATTFSFEGQLIPMDNKVGIFITMNPGYTGRTELPESIKALFRPVVCIVPDLQMICEIMLFSEGFLMAKVLAKKMTVLYKLASEQLSKQHHYDFKLRAIKSVLVMAGELKRSADFEEDVVLMRALRDMNLPKLVFEDVPLFLGLLGDLFPGMSCPRVQYPSLHEAVNAVLLENKYISLPHQVDKVIQLYETMMTRHTIMVVGPTCGGKSVVINMLAQAQTKLGVPTKLFTINPKERSVIELYGVLDPITRDWTDGLLSNLFRELNKPTDKVEKKYIVFDGDVDALWIENMNSVMDDNKILTLANGERIRLQKHCSMIFEVFDLQYANPSTVSRCGMVYVDPKNLRFDPYWQKWLKVRFDRRQNLIEYQSLLNLYNRFVPSLIQLIFKGDSNKAAGDPLKTIIPLTDLSLVKQLTHMLEALLDEDTCDEEQVIECIFVEALYWSLGAGLIEDDRVKFDAFVKQISTMNISVSELGVGPGELPGGDSLIFDHYWENSSRIWVTWQSKVPNYVHNLNLKFNEILVPTKDTVSLKWVLSLFLKMEMPILFSGESGTSKTATIKSYLKSLDQDSYQILEMNFSSRTTSLDCQRNLESHTEKRTRDVFGPPVGKRLVVFVDDLNMPQVDPYGTQQPIAMLKLLLGYSGFYDRGTMLNWKTLKDLDWVAAMGNPGGGRNSVDPRFISLFSFINVVFPSDESIYRIYNSILSGHTVSFVQEIRESIEMVTSMTMTLFKGVFRHLPPTPSKFHYIFSLRDFSRVYCGLCCIKPERFETRNELLRVWRHECLRVFTDRLVDNKDRLYVNDLIQQLVETNATNGAQYILANPIIYGDYATVLNSYSIKYYEDLKDYDNINTIFNEILEEYRKIDSLPLVLFNDALEHLSRIYRVLRLPQGHCLLSGMGNVGKFSLSKLAAFTAGYEFFTIELNRGYNEASFKEDLKILYEKLCVENKNIAFLFKDQFIVEENFLELINNMLTLGTVPALYADDEKDKIADQLQQQLSQFEKSLTKDLIWQYFAKRAISNLHIILSMNSANPNLAKRCRNFPGIVNNTHINWMFSWPKQALLAVANEVISDDIKLISPDMRPALVDHAIYVHKTAVQASEEYYEKMRRKNYMSPKNYLDFLNLYIKLLYENDSFINSQSSRLSGGMTKLIESGKQLTELNTKLSVQRIAVAEKTQSCQKLLNKIAHATDEAENKQSLALTKSAQIEVQTRDITREKAEARTALSKAMPALDAARLALDDIDRNDVTEIRSFAKPPKPVQTIGECIVVLKGIKDVSWKSAKGLMTDPNFLRSLKELDVDNIPPKNISVVKYLLKEMNMSIEEMRDKSRAGAGLMKFVQAVVGYCDVYKDVKPKKDKVERLEKEYNLTMHELEKITSQLNHLEQTLAHLKAQYEQAMIEKKLLEDETDLMQRRLHAADKLIKGLSSEKIRWQREIEELNAQKTLIIGDCLLCAGFLAYTSAFTWQFREDLIYDKWFNNVKKLEIPISDPFSLTKLLTNDVEISRWNSEGLPPDDLSVQNAILATKSNQFPLCIDPQQQALNWIKQREKGNNFKISSFNDSDFMKHLELAVKYGSSFLFQDVDDYVDPLINNIVAKEYKTQGGNTTVVVGDKAIDYDMNFRLYLNTKLPNPNFAPGIYGLAAVINFMVTLKGLEEQLLGVIVRIEKNELEERREQLIFETSNNKRLLKDLEDSLLRELAQSKGNMLDNVELLNTLENTKSKSSEVAEKLRLAALTSDEIDRNRDIYRSVAKLGAILFFVLADMSTVNPMYQYSLSSYIKVFEYSLKRSLTDTRVAIRLRNITDMLKYNVYNYGCTGIFEEHKLLFSFQITLKLKLEEGVIAEDELDFLTKGNVSVERSTRAKPFPWIPDDAWECVLILGKVSPTAFDRIVEDIEAHGEEWKEWYEHDSPESTSLPLDYETSLTGFHRLMLLRCFRLDRLFCAISNYIMANMGEQYVTPPIVSLNSIFEQSMPSTPVVFILSAGSDPTSDLLKFAEEIGIKNTNLKILSLGQGQEKVAMSLLSAAMTHGHWLILQNCHLLIKFLKDLEKEFDNVSKPHPDFRLWLTTEPVQSFPISILQRSLKVVTEPPNGLKHNLRSTYVKLVPSNLKGCAHVHYPSLLFVLSFFHAVVQERRKYGKIGWNIAYDFNNSDFVVCNTILENTLQKLVYLDEGSGVIPWTSLKYLIGEVMYGGRAIDDFDRRVLNTYMDEYMGDFLLDAYQKFHFYADNEFEYLLPDGSTKDEFLQYIEMLPMTTTPEVLGLHENAEISYFMNAGQSMLDYMKSLQPRTKSTETSASREEQIDKIAKDMLVKIPEEFNIEKIVQQLPPARTPSIVVLLQELARFNLLTSNLLVSLKTLRRAIAGEVGMNNDLEEISNSLYFGTIPQSWRRLAPETKKSLAAWIVFHLDRYKQYSAWAFDSEPEIMWLSGLHVPESYMTALVQMTCRKNNWSLDKSTLFTKVLSPQTDEDAIDSFSHGKMVTGLYLEGAGWDVNNCCLVKQEPKKLVTSMPTIKIIPIQSSKLRLANTLRTPVYVTSDRRNSMGMGLVFEADLNTRQHLSHWILQGVCLVLNPE